MTRAEAIELAAKAADEHVCDRAFRLDGAGKAYPLCRCGTIDYTGSHRTEAVVDALLEAGMTFGEEYEQVGWTLLLDGVTSWSRGPQEPKGNLEHAGLWQPVFVHRPQGESK